MNIGRYSGPVGAVFCPVSKYVYLPVAISKLTHYSLIHIDKLDYVPRQKVVAYLCAAEILRHPPEKCDSALMIRDVRFELRPGQYARLPGVFRNQQ